MAHEKWVIVGERWCEYRKGTAYLLERRVTPAGFQQQLGSSRTIERKCDCALECNMAGYPCKWAFTRPENDPFEVV